MTRVAFEFEGRPYEAALLKPGEIIASNTPGFEFRCRRLSDGTTAPETYNDVTTTFQLEVVPNTSEHQGVMMGRLVKAVPRVQMTGGQADGDNYLARVAKYIPGEIVATYLSLMGFMKNVDPADEAKLPALWVILILCFVLTPVYFWKFTERDQPKLRHLVVSSLAFLAWAYALGGVFESMGWYKPWLGSVILALYTLLAGLVPPPKEGDN